MDIMSPLARTEVDARLDLMRLADLLAQVGPHLNTLGIEVTKANALQVAALQLRRDIATAREASLVSTARRIPA